MNKYDLWKERIADYRNSNLKAWEWCEKNNLPITTLRHWVTKFNKEEMNTDKQTNDFVGVTVPAIENSQKETITIYYNKIYLSGTDINLLEFDTKY